MSDWTFFACRSRWYGENRQWRIKVNTFQEVIRQVRYTQCKQLIHKSYISRSSKAEIQFTQANGLAWEAHRAVVYHTWRVVYRVANTAADLLVYNHVHACSVKITELLLRYKCKSCNSSTRWYNSDRTHRKQLNLEELYTLLRYKQWLKWFCEAGGLTWRSHVGANPIHIPTPLIWRYLGIK